MFVTNEAHRSELEALICDAGESVWRSAELSIDMPWFVVSVIEVVPDESNDGNADGIANSTAIRRTLLVANVEDLVSLTGSLDISSCTLTEVHVVLPPYSESANRWRMEPLVAVWGKAEYSASGLPLVGRAILETANGAKYWDFPTSLYEGQSNELALRITF